MDTWQSVYLYHSPTPHSQMVSLLVDLAEGVVLLTVIAFLSIGSYRQIRRNDYSSARAMIFLYLFSLFFCFSIFLNLGYAKQRSQLGSATAARHCTDFEGKVTRIDPETGDGHMAFEIAGRLFRYDDHHFALSAQLCSPGGPPICVGEFARVCLHSDADGEILRIERRAGG